jgi:hypothetical protein
MGPPPGAVRGIVRQDRNTEDGEHPVGKLDVSQASSGDGVPDNGQQGTRGSRSRITVGAATICALLALVMAPAEASGTAVDSTFAEAENYGVGIDPTSVIAADFDGAGGMDLAVANQESDDFSVLLNENDGTFGRFIEYGAGVSPSSVDVADFDGDGHPDLAVANQGTAGTSFAISVLTNEGDATFGGAANYAVGIFPRSVIAADLGGDGAPDIAVANANTGTISIPC